jgi:hypothetical protein
MKKIIIASAAVYALSVGMAHAKDEIGKGCTFKTLRTACPGKTDEMLKPYSKKNPTIDAKKEHKTAEECKTAGMEFGKIIRGGVLAKKQTTIYFDGKEIGKQEDTKPCDK